MANSNVLKSALLLLTFLFGEVFSVATLVSVTPATRAFSAPADSVTFLGDFGTGVTSVTMNGAALAAGTFTDDPVGSDDTLVVTVPKCSVTSLCQAGAGLTTFVLSTTAGSITTTAGFFFYNAFGVVSPSSIHGLSPSPVLVTLERDFETSTSVYDAVSFSCVFTYAGSSTQSTVARAVPGSTTQLACTQPVGATVAGTVTVGLSRTTRTLNPATQAVVTATVTIAQDASLGSDQILAYLTPTISTVTGPGGGIAAAGGSTITIVGTGFVAGAAVSVASVTLGGAACAVTSSTATQIECTAPAGYNTAASGAQTLVVTTNVGLSVSAAGPVYATPAVTGVTGSALCTDGGALVTITGTNFGVPPAPAAGVVTASVGGSACSEPTLHVSDTAFVCSVPAGAAGAVGYVVSNARSGASPSATLAPAYASGAACAAPTVTAFSPSFFLDSVGTATAAGLATAVLTVYGTNFGAGSSRSGTDPTLVLGGTSLGLGTLVPSLATIAPLQRQAATFTVPAGFGYTLGVVVSTAGAGASAAPAGGLSYLADWESVTPTSLSSRSRSGFAAAVAGSALYLYGQAAADSETEDLISVSLEEVATPVTTAADVVTSAGVSATGKPVSRYAAGLCSLVPAYDATSAASATRTVLLMHGGRDRAGANPLLDDTWALLLPQRAWYRLATSSPLPVFNPSLATLGGKLYRFGGLDASGTVVGQLFVLTLDTSSYTAATSGWSALATLAHPRHASGFAALPSRGSAGSLLAFGGVDEAGTLYNDVQIFDVSAATWSELTVSASPLPSARMGAAVAVDPLDGYLRVHGGVSDPAGAAGSSLNDLWVLSLNRVASNPRQWSRVDAAAASTDVWVNPRVDPVPAAYAAYELFRTGSVSRGKELILRGFNYGASILEVTPRAPVFYADYGASLEVTLIGRRLVADPIGASACRTCLFTTPAGTTSVAGTVPGGTSRLACKVPALALNTVATLAVSRHCYPSAAEFSAGVWTLFGRGPRVVRVDPPYLHVGTALSYVYVFAEGLLPLPGLACLYAGSVTATASFITRNLVRCDKPTSLGAGAVSVGITWTGSSASAFTSLSGSLTLAAVPAVTSVDVATGDVAGGTVVTVTGTNFAASPYLSCLFGADWAYAVFATRLSATSVRCVAPAHPAGTSIPVYVALNRYEYGTSAATFAFTELPEITGFSPHRGYRLVAGLPVTLKGRNFFNVATGDVSQTYCRFGSTVVAAEAAGTASEIVCKTPTAASQGTVALQVSNTGSSGPFYAGETRYYPGFTGRYVAGQSPVVPVFEYYGDATFVSMTPDSWYSGAAAFDVRVEGTNFVRGPELACMFSGGGAQVTAQYLSSSRLVCPAMTMPASCTVFPCTLDLIVQNGVDSTDPRSATAGSVTSTYKFVFSAEPTVTSITPSSGRWTGGLTVTIAGSGFDALEASSPSKLMASFGTLLPDSPNAVVCSRTSGAALVCATPRSPYSVSPFTGDVDVHVSRNGGVLWSTQHVLFSFTAEVVLSSLVPLSRPAAGGAATLTITGAGFLDPATTAGTLKCYFTVAGSSTTATFIDGSTVSCPTPAAATSANTLESVSVSTNAQAYSPSEGLAFMSDPAWTVNGVRPLGVEAAVGGTVTVYGSSFVATATLTCHFTKPGFAWTAAATFVSDRLLTCDFPAVAAATHKFTAVTVDVSLNGQQLSGSSPAVSLLLHGTPSITATAPARAPATGGALVTFYGADFDTAMSEAVCVFSGVGVAEKDHPRGAAAPTNSHVVCRTPPVPAPGPAVPGLRVSPSASTVSGTGLAASFVFYPRETVTALFPLRGPSNSGYTLTLYGTGFVDDAATTLPVVRFRSPNLATVYATVGRASADGAGAWLTVAVPNFAHPATVASMVVDVSNNNQDFTVASVKVRVDQPFTVTSLWPVTTEVSMATLVVTVRGTNFAANPHLRCRFGASDVVVATFQSRERILCTPTTATTAAAGTYAVAVSLNADYYITLAGTSLTVVPAPVISAITPAGASTLGVGTVSLTGSNFALNTVTASGTMCVFCTSCTAASTGAGRRVVAAVAADSLSLTCSVPANLPTATNYKVYVSVNGGQSGVAAAGTFTVYSPEAVASLAPYAGPPAGGTTITVAGANFVAVAGPASPYLACRFYDMTTTTVVSASLQSATSLVCAGVPAGAAGTRVTVEVSNNGVDFTNFDLTFEYQAALVVTYIYPLHGYITGGDPVTLRGTSFPSDAAGFLKCRFDGTFLTTAVLTASDEVVCPSATVPSARTATVELSANAQDYVAAPSSYEFIAEARVSSIVPTTVPDRSGFIITVTGVNFPTLAARPLVNCRFGPFASDAPPIVDSPTQMRCVAPAPVNVNGATSRTFLVQVTTNGQQYGFSGTSVTVHQLPIVLTISPTQGISSGDTGTASMRITGLYFAAPMYCKFGAAPATAAIVLSATQLTCATASLSSAAGAGAPTFTRVPVEISKDGVNFSDNKAEYEYFDLPVAVSVTPTSCNRGPGTTVTIVGISLGAGVLGSTFGTAPVCRWSSGATHLLGTEPTLVTPTILLCKTPALDPAQNPYAVEVSPNGNQFATAHSNFLAIQFPSVSAVSPSRAIKTGGIDITVYGSDFVNSCPSGNLVGCQIIGCRFHYYVSYAKSMTTTKIVCTSPSYFTGTFPIEITTNGNAVPPTFTEQGFQFTFDAFPAIYSAYPLSGGKAGGTVVTVEGKDFVSGLVVCLFEFSGPEATMTAATVQVNSVFIAQNLITCAAPAAAAAGIINLAFYVPSTIPTPTRVPNTNFAFRYVTEVPSVTRIYPPLGSAFGGTVVSVFGTNFYDKASIMCRFGCYAPVAGTWLSQEAITCVSPAVAPAKDRENVDVSVARNGATFFVQNVAFQFVRDPYVSAVSPTAGPRDGGTLVTIFGADFTDPAVPAAEVYVYCLFGAQPIRALSATSTVAVCRAPPLPPATSAPLLVNLWLSVEAGNQYLRRPASAVNTIAPLTDTPFSFLYDDRVTVTAVFPAHGPRAGGTLITLRGASYLAGTTRCRFSHAPSTLVVAATAGAPTLITCATPAATLTASAPLRVMVEVSANAGLDWTNQHVLYTYLENPAVTAVEPARTPGGAAVTLTLFGSSFERSEDLLCRAIPYPASLAAWPPVDVVATWLSPTAVTCPFGSSAVKFPVGLVPVPTLLCVSAVSMPSTSGGPAGLCPSAAGPVCVAVPISAFKGTYTVSPTFGAGPVTATVPCFGSIALDSAVVMQAASPMTANCTTLVPVVSTVPANAAWATGTATVCLGGTVLTDYVQPTSFSLFGSAAVELSLNAGRDFTASGVAAEFFNPPQLASLFPTFGPEHGGSTVTITGTNLAGALSYVWCYFGPTVDRPVASTYASATRVECTAPARAPGTVNVAISTNDKASLSVSTLAFEYIAAPIVLELNPFLGQASGGTLITVVGSFFVNRTEPAARCRFETSPGVGPTTAVTYVTSTQLLCATPNVAGAVGLRRLQVSLNGVDYTRSSPQFWHVPVATVSAVTPDTAPVAGGALTVTVAGSNFVNSALLLCRFSPAGADAAPVLFVSSTALLCTAPASASPRSVLVRVLNNGVDLTAASVSFTYLPAPQVSAVFPTHGLAFASLVTLYGTNLNATAGSRPCCHFGSMAGTPVLSAPSAYEVVCRPPVQFDTATALLSVSVRYSFNCLTPGSATLPAFAYHQPNAMLETIVPHFGPAAGGQVVSILGAALPYSSDVRCRFSLIGTGDVVLPASAGPSATVITCVSPAASAANILQYVDVELTLNAITFTRRRLRYMYVQNPTLASLSPYAYPIPPTATAPLRVTIVGNYFMNVASSRCIFELTATQVKTQVASEYRSPTTIVCVTPAVDADPGKRVFTLNVELSPLVVSQSPLSFYYYDFSELTLTSVSMATNIEGAPNLITVKGAGFRSVTCSVASQYVRGTYLPLGDFSCETPTNLIAGTYPVEISNDGKFFTSGSGRTITLVPCPVGNYCNGTATVPCPRGHLCPVTRITTPYVCPAGTETTSVGATNCTLCPPGRVCGVGETGLTDICPAGYVCNDGLEGRRWPSLNCPPSLVCPAGTLALAATNTSVPVQNRPVPCPAGFFCAIGVASVNSQLGNYSTPQPCFAGFFCPVGQSDPQGQGPCPEGSFCFSGQEPQLCPAGTFCPGIGNQYAIPCPPGTWNPSLGSASCRDCAKGFYCPVARMTEMLPCPPGKVCDDFALSSAQRLCPPGSYCQNATDTLVQGATPNAPRPCLPGSYCPGNVGYAELKLGDPLYAQPCDAGYYCASGTGVSSGLGPCPPGTYSPAGSSSCTSTPRGTYAPGVGNTLPVLCRISSYSSRIGADKCEPCPSGTSCVREGTVVPEPCAPGTYRNAATDGVKCIPCPTGRWLNATASEPTSIFACSPCPAGRYCPVEGTFNITDLTAPLCPAGSYCPPGSDTGTLALTKCPAGYVCGVGFTDLTARSIVCPAGYYCSQGTAVTEYLNYPCPKNQYCPAGTGATPPQCPQGTVTVGTRSESIAQCVPKGDTIKLVTPGSTAGPRGNLRLSALSEGSTGAEEAADEAVADDEVISGDGAMVEALKVVVAGSAEAGSLPPAPTPAQFLVPVKLRASGGGQRTALQFSSDGSFTIGPTFGVHFLKCNFSSLPQDMNYQQHFELRLRTGNATDAPVLALPPAFGRQPDKARREFVLSIIPAIGAVPEAGVTVFVEIKLLTAQYLGMVDQLASTLAVESVEPRQQRFGTAKSFMVFLSSDAGASLPLNAPPLLGQVHIEYANASGLDPDPYALVAPPDPSLFWGQDTFRKISFLPYFSSCEGFDSRIPLTLLLENNNCTLVSADETAAVTKFAPFRKGVSDACLVRTTCAYEENLSDTSKATPKWFQAGSGQVLFYLSRFPMLATETPDALTNQLPVAVGAVTGFPAKSAGAWVPGTVTLKIRYHQFSKEERTIITAEVDYADWQLPVLGDAGNATAGGVNGSAAGNVTTYRLVLDMQPMQYLEVLNAFAFDILTYILLFVILGMTMILLVLVVTLLAKVVVYFTSGFKAQPRPSVRAILASLRTPFLGVGVAVGFILLVGVAVTLLVRATKGLTYSVGGGTVLSDDDIRKIQGGRLGAANVIIGVVGMFRIFQVFLPFRRPDQILTEMQMEIIPIAVVREGVYDGETVEKVAKQIFEAQVLKDRARVKAQRAHAFFISLVLTPLLVHVVEFSYSPFYSANAFPSTFILYVVKLTIDKVINWATEDTMICSLIMTTHAIIEFSIGMGANGNFILFVLLYMFSVFLEVLERILFDPLSWTWERWSAHVTDTVRLWFHRTVLRRALKGKARPVIPRKIINEVVDDMNTYAGHCVELILFPVVMFAFISWNDQLGISELYGARPRDLYYILGFQSVVMFSQMVGNAIIHHFQLVVWQLPVEEYVLKCKQRFENRKRLWMANDNSYNKKLSPEHWGVDETAFSSQLYLIWSLFCAAFLMLVLGLIMMLRATYQPFSDPVMFLLMAVCVGLLWFGEKALVGLGRVTRVWNLPSSRYADDLEVIQLANLADQMGPILDGVYISHGSQTDAKVERDAGMELVAKLFRGGRHKTAGAGLGALGLLVKKSHAVRPNAHEDIDVDALLPHDDSPPDSLAKTPLDPKRPEVSLPTIDDPASFTASGFANVTPRLVSPRARQLFIDTQAEWMASYTGRPLSEFIPLYGPGGAANAAGGGAGGGGQGPAAAAATPPKAATVFGRFFASKAKAPVVVASEDGAGSIDPHVPMPLSVAATPTEVAAIGSNSSAGNRRNPFPGLSSVLGKNDAKMSIASKGNPFSKKPVAVRGGDRHLAPIQGRTESRPLMQSEPSDPSIDDLLNNSDDDIVL